MSDDHGAAESPCGVGGGDCGCAGTCRGGPAGAAPPASEGPCGGTCGGKCDDCADRARAGALDWGRLQANSNWALSEFWRQATIGDTFSSTTGENIPLPLLPLMSRIDPLATITRFKAPRVLDPISMPTEHTEQGTQSAHLQIGAHIQETASEDREFAEMARPWSQSMVTCERAMTQWSGLFQAAPASLEGQLLPCGQYQGLIGQAGQFERQENGCYLGPSGCMNYGCAGTCKPNEDRTDCLCLQQYYPDGPWYSTWSPSWSCFQAGCQKYWKVRASGSVPIPSCATDSEKAALKKPLYLRVCNLAKAVCRWKTNNLCSRGGNDCFCIDLKYTLCTVVSDHYSRKDAYPATFWPDDVTRHCSFPLSDRVYHLEMEVSCGGGNCVR